MNSKRRVAGPIVREEKRLPAGVLRALQQCECLPDQSYLRLKSDAGAGI
jgi:hypothetical protein